MIDLIEIIDRFASEYKFSDIHLKEDYPLILRINGELMEPNEDVITSAELNSFVHNFININSFSNF